MRRSSAIGRMIGTANVASGWDQVPFAAIGSRPAGDIRPPVAEHVVAMAETIAAVGLLHPVVVDREKRLLAGRHRVEAFRILGLSEAEQRVAAILELAGAADEFRQPGAALPERLAVLAQRIRELDLDRFHQHHPDGLVPVRIRNDLDASGDPEAARQAEVAENDIRRDFTRNEILAYTQQLRAAGYDDSPGRPRAGTKALVPALVGIVGKSRRTIMRILAEEREARSTGGGAPPAAVDRQQQDLQRLRRAILAYQKHVPVAPAALASALDQAVEAIDQALVGGQ